MKISDLLDVLTKAQTYAGDVEVVLKRLEAEGEKTFLKSLELVLTGESQPGNAVTLVHSSDPSIPAVATDPTPEVPDSSDA